MDLILASHERNEEKHEIFKVSAQIVDLFVERRNRKTGNNLAFIGRDMCDFSLKLTAKR